MALKSTQTPKLLLLLFITYSICEPTLTPPVIATENESVQTPPPPADRNLADAHPNIITKSTGTFSESQITQLDSVTAALKGLPVATGTRKRKPGELAIDFYNVVISDLVKYNDRIAAVRAYVPKVLNVSPNQNVVVQNVVIGTTPVQNRFRVRLIDRKTSEEDMYYLDIDWEDGNNDKTQIKRAIVINLADKTLDPYYNGDYQHTLQKDCETIRKRLGNPITIECIPLVNSEGYVLQNTYTAVVTTMVKGKEFKTRKQVIVNLPGPNRNYRISPQNKDFPAVQLIKKELTQRLKKMRWFAGKARVIKMIKSKIFNKKILQYQTEISHFRHNNKRNIRKGDKLYQKNLKRLLSITQINLIKNNDNFDKTYNLIREKSDEVNQFNVNTAIKRAVFELNNQFNYRVYRSRIRHYKKEKCLTELLERLDDMRFNKDKELDDNFEFFSKGDYFNKF